MNNTLQARIHELESTLARLLHDKDKDAEGPPKSIVDLKMWMSSPIAADHSVSPVVSSYKMPTQLYPQSNLAIPNASGETPRASRVSSLALSATASSGTIDPALAVSALVSTSISPAHVAPLSRANNKRNPKTNKLKLASANETLQATISRATQQTKPFSALAASDLDSDSELSDLSERFSKRARYVSPVKVEGARVTRRLVIYSTS